MRFFRVYTRLLFKRRFKKVWLRQEYDPVRENRTVYYLNHHSWWDGLIPFLLNEYHFKQNARALMEDKQMRRYGLFRKIGAFSINRDDPRKAITSLRYAVQSMQREHASLFIYPEGKIRPEATPMHFEGGLAWLHSKVPEVDYVPVAIHINTIRHDKPELFLYVGPEAQIPDGLTNEETTKLFEQKLEKLLETTRATAGFEDEGFKRFV